MSRKKKRTIIVDGDIPAFMVAAVNEQATHWGDGIWSVWSDEYACKNDVDSFMEMLADELKADHMVVAISHPHNFRNDVLPTYKENRKGYGKRPPLMREMLKEYLLNEYDSFMRPGLEGDDVMGILATAKNHPIAKTERILVTIDKDLKTIPCQVAYWNNFNHVMNPILEVTEEQADYYHMCQTLAGDQVDGYGGCPGVGWHRADEALHLDPHVLEPYTHTFKSGAKKGQTEQRYEKQFGDYTVWETVVSYYRAVGLTEEHALRQARVARICRNTDYDFKKREVILWTPPT